jgi:hypothetical protein
MLLEMVRGWRRGGRHHGTRCYDPRTGAIVMSGGPTIVRGRHRRPSLSASGRWIVPACWPSAGHRFIVDHALKPTSASKCTRIFTSACAVMVPAPS